MRPTRDRVQCDPVSSGPASSLRARPRWGRIALAVALGVAPFVMAALWLQRSHVVVYRAWGDECAVTIRYAAHDAERGPIEAHGAWQSEIVTLEHGEVASVVVSAGRECDVVRCELEEDGVVVARAEGRAAAICSAATAR